MGYQTVVAQLFDGRMSDRHHATRVWEHIAEVQAEIDCDRLLTFDVRAGWRPLCEFLRLPVPDAPVSLDQFVQAVRGRGLEAVTRRARPQSGSPARHRPSCQR